MAKSLHIVPSPPLPLEKLLYKETKNPLSPLSGMTFPPIKQQKA